MYHHVPICMQWKLPRPTVWRLCPTQSCHRVAHTFSLNITQHLPRSPTSLADVSFHPALRSPCRSGPAPVARTLDLKPRSWAHQVLSKEWLSECQYVVPSSFLFLVAMPGAPSSVLAPSSKGMFLLTCLPLMHSLGRPRPNATIASSGSLAIGLVRPAQLWIHSRMWVTTKEGPS